MKTAYKEALKLIQSAIMGLMDWDEKLNDQKVSGALSQLGARQGPSTIS